MTTPPSTKFTRLCHLVKGTCRPTGDAKLRLEEMIALFDENEPAIQTEAVPDALRKVACVDDGQKSVIRAFEMRGYQIRKISNKTPNLALKECNKQVRICSDLSHHAACCCIYIIDVCLSHS